MIKNMLWAEKKNVIGIKKYQIFINMGYAAVNNSSYDHIFLRLI